MAAKLDVSLPVVMKALTAQIIPAAFTERTEQQYHAKHSIRCIVWMLEPRLAVSHARMLSPILEGIHTIIMNYPFET